MTAAPTGFSISCSGCVIGRRLELCPEGRSIEENQQDDRKRKVKAHSDDGAEHLADNLSRALTVLPHHLVYPWRHENLADEKIHDAPDGRRDRCRDQKLSTPCPQL